MACDTEGGFVSVLNDTCYVVGDAGPNTFLSVSNRFIPIEPIWTAP